MSGASENIADRSAAWQQAGSDGGNGGYLAGQWPTFWNGEITGWTGLIRVDNVTYTWLGDPAPLPTVVNQTAFSYTSTRSIFTMNVDGKIGMNITFLSPVTPTDMLRQSVPVSYMNVAVYSIDGNQHDVQLYSDVSAGKPSRVFSGRARLTISSRMDFW